MAIARRVYISSPRDEHLDDRRNALKWAIVAKIEALGYEAQVFGSPEGSRGLAQASWSASAAEEVMQRCVGAAVLGFPIWQGSGIMSGSRASLVTEYCHYEGALARTCKFPILAVLEEGAEERVFFNRYGGDPILRVPADADLQWVEGPAFGRFLKAWNARIGERCDLFLAYSGKQEGTAGRVGEILKGLGATVLDWKSFAGGKSILEQVEKAAARTSGAVFLFTRDDQMAEGNQAAPRDNVIFEAGFFMRSKGHDRVLVIREEGAKMPADLGGVIYESLADGGDAHALRDRLQLFLTRPSGAGVHDPGRNGVVRRTDFRPQ